MEAETEQELDRIEPELRRAVVEEGGALVVDEAEPGPGNSRSAGESASPVPETSADYGGGESEPEPSCSAGSAGEPQMGGSSLAGAKAKWAASAQAPVRGVEDVRMTDAKPPLSWAPNFFVPPTAKPASRRAYFVNFNLLL